MSLISLKKLKHIENLKWLLVDSILSYFRHCEPCQPDDKYTFPHQVNAMSPFETCEGDCLQTDHAEKATCREVCHLVTQDNHRSLSSIWHFATPIFPGLHLDIPWILHGWVQHYTHCRCRKEGNLRDGLSPSLSVHPQKINPGSLSYMWYFTTPTFSGYLPCSLQG